MEPLPSIYRFTLLAINRQFAGNFVKNEIIFPEKVKNCVSLLSLVKEQVNLTKFFDPDHRTFSLCTERIAWRESKGGQLIQVIVSFLNTDDPA
jgi:hypothetical protein